MASTNELMHRLPAHRRRIECCAYEREDGLWDLHGVLSDVKGVDNWLADQTVKAGELLHEMHITLTVDNTFTIHAAQARTLHAPYRGCPDCNGAYEKLIGISLTRGFHKRVSELFGGTRGCTHINALLAPLATTAFQAIGTWHIQQGHEHRETTKRSIDGCYGLRSDGDAVRVHFPGFYNPPQSS